jgi:hypothetical protein
MQLGTLHFISGSLEARKTTSAVAPNTRKKAVRGPQAPWRATGVDADAGTRVPASRQLIDDVDEE